jgi:hypothetical protein
MAISSGIKVFWRQIKQELSEARNGDLTVAVIAGFAAWIITQLLRALFG